MRKLKYVGTKVGSGVLTLWLAAIAIFVAVHLMPGGFAQVVLGPLSDPARKAAVTDQYGLDEPLVVQYLKWQSEALHGNFGVSLISHKQVGSELAGRLPVTAELTLLAGLVAVVVGVTLGVAAAVSARSRSASYAARLLTGIGLSLPDFALGTLVVFIFSKYSVLGLRVGSYVPVGEDLGANLRSVLLPAGVLAVFGVSAVARVTRDAVLDVLTKTYVTAAVARGESPLFILRHHVLRNASIPIATVVATVVAYLLGGAVIVEQLFGIPGIGQYLVSAINRRDYAVVQAAVLLGAAVFIGVNMVMDLLYAVIDPRIGSRREAA